MTSSIQIRRATPADHAALQAVFGELDELHRQRAPWLFRKPDSDPRPPEYLAELLAEPSIAVFVAVEQTCVGAAITMLRDNPDFPLFVPAKFALVDNIAVRADHRRRGIGRQLFLACESWAKERKAAWIELGVYEFNQGAREFYQSLGFETVMRKMRRPCDNAR